MTAEQWMFDRANATSDPYAECRENETCPCDACVEFRAEQSL